MPNCCNNNLYISHPDPKMMDKAVEAWNSGKFLGTLVPEPDYTNVKVKPTFDFSGMNGKPQPKFVDPDQAWWDWRLQNWGTKWDIGKSQDYDNSAQLNGGSMFVYFDSAWSPPCDAYATLVEMGYSIKAYYYEGGCSFCGRWEDGDDDYYDIAPPDGVKFSVWVKENIPADIDSEMGISESYLAYEEDEEEFENA